MAILIQIFAPLLLLALMIAGLLLIVAPRYGGRMLKKTAAFTGLFVLGIVLLNQLLHAISPVTLVLGAAAVSGLAYFVREHRLGRRVPREGLRYAERTPVIPQHVNEEGEE